MAASFAVAGRAAAATDADVVVIGAGAAGIAAAHALRAAGRQAVVLEARGRTGGRAFTDASLGAAYDAGAMFIHWAERNPWVQIARDLGIATPAESWGSGFRVFADGRPMAGHEIEIFAANEYSRKERRVAVAYSAKVGFPIP